MDADHIMAAVDDETLLDFLANHPCLVESNFGGPLTKERKGDKLMAYAKMYMIPHGSGHNDLVAGLEVVQAAAAAAIEARARRLFTGSFMCSIEQPSSFLHERDLTDFFKLCTVDSSCTRLESWPGCELRECAHEKRLLCWAWLRAGGMGPSWALPWAVLEHSLTGLLKGTLKRDTCVYSLSLFQIRSFSRERE